MNKVVLKAVIGVGVVQITALVILMKERSKRIKELKVCNKDIATFAGINNGLVKINDELNKEVLELKEKLGIAMSGLEYVQKAERENLDRLSELDEPEKDNKSAIDEQSEYIDDTLEELRSNEENLRKLRLEKESELEKLNENKESK